MLKFHEARLKFEKTDWKARPLNAHNYDLSSAYKFTTAIWNNYDELVNDKDTVMNIFSRTFTDDDCKKFRPLGDFKDLEELCEDQEDIYYHWVNNFTRIRTDSKKKGLSLLDVAIEQVEKKSKELLQEELWDSLIEDCFSMMFYNLSGGSYDEIRVCQELRAKYAKKDHMKFIVAEADQETDDIDAIIFNNETGKKHNISIKNGYALREVSLLKFKFLKKKTKPDYYIGFADKNDDFLTKIHTSTLTEDKWERVKYSMKKWK